MLLHRHHRLPQQAVSAADGGCRPPLLPSPPADRDECLPRWRINAWMQGFPAPAEVPNGEGLRGPLPCWRARAWPNYQQLRLPLHRACSWDGGNNPEQTDYVSVRNLVAACPPSLKRFTLTTSAGVERSGQFPFIILNAFGGHQGFGGSGRIFSERTLLAAILPPPPRPLYPSGQRPLSDKNSVAPPPTHPPHMHTHTLPTQHPCCHPPSPPQACSSTSAW